MAFAKRTTQLNQHRAKKNDAIDIASFRIIIKVVMEIWFIVMKSNSTPHRNHGKFSS